MKQNRSVPAEAAAYPALLTVSVSPHIRGKDTTRRLMLDVLIALAPALVFGMICFGWRAALLTVLSVGACVFFEWGYERLLHRRNTVGDLSAAVTGVLLAMNVPATLPPPMIVLAAFFAIVVVKQLFGGIGRNLVNPALAARVFLFISFPAHMGGEAFGANNLLPDATAGVTPLVSLSSGALPDGMTLLDLFLGRSGGCIGEISTALLLLGGVYLLVRRVITWHIPAAYLGTVALLTLFLPKTGWFDFYYMACQLCAGGLVLGAFFMATDYATSPVTPRGRLLYGAVCGVLTVFIRYFCANPEGVSFAILISNLLVYYFDRYLRPRRFGEGRAAK